VFIPLFGLEYWGNLTDKSSLKASLSSKVLIITFSVSAFLCTLFNFQLSEGAFVNLSIVPLTMAFFILSWLRALFVLLLYIFAEVGFSIYKLSQGNLSLQIVKNVFVSFQQGFIVIFVFAVIMCVCSIWAQRRSFSLRSAGFVVCLLLFTLFNYIYMNHFKQFKDFDFLAFIGFIFIFNLIFLIAARLIVVSIEKKQALKELVLREEVYRRLVEDSPDAVAISTGRQWRYINKTLVDLFGGDNKEQLLAKSSYDFVHPDYLQMNQARVTRVEEGSTANLEEQIFLKLNGEPFYAETISIPTLYHGEPAIHTIIRDVTKRREDHALLVQAEKLKMAGQLAAGIAHEIRNPLTAIKGFMKLMKPNMKEEYLNIMSEEIERIENIITELLGLSKPNKAQFQQVDITKTIKQIVTLLQPQAHLQNIVFETDYRAGRSLILCDEGQLKQAFINFLKNAIESMPSGGIARIRTDSTHNCIQIEIIDNGVGIPADKLNHLGDPFFTTKETGTGLGFMISKKIIEDHNGQLTVRSMVGEGTTISILLPLSE
jgi:PAS domain S-box-containing protein